MAGVTKNPYSYPVEVHQPEIINYSASPAHVGRLSQAVDFVVPVGTPITAAYGGQVVDVKQDSDRGGVSADNDRDGNYIEIQHEHNEYSIYEHIEKGGSLVKVGDRVNKGQLIGYSGDTGWLAHLGPHLHFDVHQYFGREPEDYTTLKITWASFRRQPLT